MCKKDALLWKIIDKCWNSNELVKIVKAIESITNEEELSLVTKVEKSAYDHGDSAVIAECLDLLINHALHTGLVTTLINLESQYGTQVKLTGDVLYTIVRSGSLPMLEYFNDQHLHSVLFRANAINMAKTAYRKGDAKILDWVVTNYVENINIDVLTSAVDVKSGVCYKIILAAAQQPVE